MKIMSFKNKRKPVDFSPDKKICEIIQAESRDGKMSCPAVLKISEKLNISKSEAGYYVDYLGLRLAKCQIGLFGHGEKGKLIRMLEDPDENIKIQIESLLEGKSLSCENVFTIAKKQNVSQVTVGSVCQSIGVKIKKCQIGAF